MCKYIDKEKIVLINATTYWHPWSTWKIILAGNLVFFNDLNSHGGLKSILNSYQTNQKIARKTCASVIYDLENTYLQAI